MTWTRSSYMEPVTSKTNARVDAPSGISSLAAPLGASCPVHSAADSATESHSSPEPIFTSELLLSCLSEYYSSVLFTWFEALRHRAPPVWTSSCCLCVLWTFCGSFTPLSQQDGPAVPAAAEATVVWGVRSPCSALSYKDHLSAGQRIPPGANYPIQSEEVLWLVEEVFGPHRQLKMKVDRLCLKRQDLNFATLYKDEQTRHTWGKKNTHMRKTKTKELEKNDQLDIALSAAI